MVGQCKNVCLILEVKKQGKGYSFYGNGFIFCSTCQAFINWPFSVYCPCCDMQARVKRRRYKKYEKKGKHKNEKLI